MGGQHRRAQRPARGRHNLDPSAKASSPPRGRSAWGRDGESVSACAKLERVYRRIDATIKSQARGGPAAGVDPFEEPPPLAAARERLEGVLDQMVRQGLDPNHVERLGDHVARGSRPGSGPDPAAGSRGAIRPGPRPACRGLLAGRPPRAPGAVLGSALPCLPGHLPDQGHIASDR